MELNSWKHLNKKDILKMTKLFQMRKGIQVFKTIADDFYPAEH